MCKYCFLGKECIDALVRRAGPKVQMRSFSQSYASSRTIARPAATKLATPTPAESVAKSTR
ncbi:hypothetical protein CLAFUW4_10867 [Fulvia fulva]|uniref:Uncharacterized protein n=1 Tax=Passalora fulva TaxID=5499 RepID=A0A9Q8PCQ3_PASFU|nr:uncharacterized protein CLAFUR5_09909 [Fulvia fulva]KAK4619672.1 hypothetical protein CLAFUR4_10872 [Fulvia fulva]KAK4620347.1 hypothetical protein CLAFUR0_10879 [Fulvia fulva]UJO20026.1 hypothetical protein CLAFUR5_09909 [Fulvia fulva]WPV16834.1 hypothetical protein CLAFUW4_10867 [Fulvia fulva]WPV32170.1 hypothetical protein CLAFUW7_10865 [Fulvia fulva]